MKICYVIVEDDYWGDQNVRGVAYTKEKANEKAEEFKEKITKACEKCRNCEANCYNIDGVRPNCFFYFGGYKSINDEQCANRQYYSDFYVVEEELYE